jgi:hypothetical protein
MTDCGESIPAKNDPKGYYGRLSVSPTATADEIKAAYRRLAKHLHPDVNANLNAAALFKAVNEAYATLSNPKLRTEYDASWYTNQEHQKPAPHREPIEPICCSKCGKVTAQPRSIVFTRVISFWMTWIRPTCGIVCSACARGNRPKGKFDLGGCWLVGDVGTDPHPALDLKQRNRWQARQEH